jgi:hypothetical protein
MVRGYHVYKNTWIPQTGETLRCEREIHNLYDQYAVAVIKDMVSTVGHEPKQISASCSLFLRRGGIISCTVDGDRRYSNDLPQGGLEIPCTLTFSASEQSLIDKIRNLCKQIDIITTSQYNNHNKQQVNEEDSFQPQKKMKFREYDDDDDDEAAGAWVYLDNCYVLKRSERHILQQNRKLNDLIINFSQKILRHQVPSLNGLTSSLALNKLQSFGKWIFCRFVIVEKIIGSL